MLAVNSPATKPLVSLDLPPALSERVINALKADPKSVDLRGQAQHFYSLGARMLELFEEDEILDVLVDTFRARAVEISDHGANAGGAGARAAGGGVGVGQEGVDFLRGLDETERQLFRVAHDRAKATRAWMADIKKP
jgi:GINS complex subunit 3